MERAKKQPLVKAQEAGEEAAHPRIAFIKSVKFRGIGLDESTCSVNRKLLAKALERESTFDVKIKLRQSVVEHTKRDFLVSAEFGLRQNAVDVAEAIVSITAKFSARFELASVAKKDMVEGFAQLEARLIFFPYLRHFVSDTSYRMGIDPIVLPMTSELE